MNIIIYIYICTHILKPVPDSCIDMFVWSLKWFLFLFALASLAFMFSNLERDSLRIKSGNIWVVNLEEWLRSDQGVKVLELRLALSLLEIFKDCNRNRLLVPFFFVAQWAATHGTWEVSHSVFSPSRYPMTNKQPRANISNGYCRTLLAVVMVWNVHSDAKVWFGSLLKPQIPEVWIVVFICRTQTMPAKSNSFTASTAAQAEVSCQAPYSLSPQYPKLRMTEDFRIQCCWAGKIHSWKQSLSWIARFARLCARCKDRCWEIFQSRAWRIAFHISTVKLKGRTLVHRLL